MSVLDETWRVVFGPSGTFDVFLDKHGYVFCGEQVGLERAMRAQLAAAAPELYRALLVAEWCDHLQCYRCNNYERQGHTKDCELAAALRKARGEVGT